MACIPAYNEGNLIGSLVKKTLNYVNEVVVCDDGSSDNTSHEAEKAGARIIRHDKNKGKGAALKSLFKYARNSTVDVIVTIDGDGQFLPEEIPKLITPIIENKSDIVIGYRFDNSSQMPSYRKFGNKMLDRVTNLASELPFMDTQSGFRAYSKNAINKINFSSDGFASDSEILVDASQKKLKISEEKVTVIYNTGKKTSTKNPVSHSSEVITSLLELVALRRPLVFLGIPGIILLLIGIAYAMIVVTIFNDTRYFSIPSTLVTLGTLIVGLMMFLMSVLLFSISRAIKRN